MKPTLIVCRCGAVFEVCLDDGVTLSPNVKMMCVECAGGRSTVRHSTQNIFFDERKSKTTPNPYNNVRFKFELEATSEFPKRVEYTDRWGKQRPLDYTGQWEDPTPKTDDNADDPNTWRPAPDNRNLPHGDWFYNDEGFKDYRACGGRIPKSTAHLPWLMLADRRTTAEEEPFTYPLRLGDNDFNGDGFMGTASPLRETHEGGFSSRGVDRVLAIKKWSDVYKACVREVMLCGRQATDVVREFAACDVKISTLYSCVRDVKADMERVEDAEEEQADPKIAYIRGAKAKTRCPRRGSAAPKGSPKRRLAPSARIAAETVNT